MANRSRHCEERSDEAIQGPRPGSGLLRFARNDVPWFAAAVLLALAAPAVAAPRSIADCEAIKEANAYNLCLASFGPVRGGGGPVYSGGLASEGKHGGGAGAARAPGRIHGGAASYSWSGRVRMEFTPGRR